MSLDKRLKEIVQTLAVANLERHHPEYGTTEESIEAIKQAFIDEGWMPPNETKAFRMTGPEWLARFEKEAEILLGVDSYPLFKKAARDASGVDE